MVESADVNFVRGYAILPILQLQITYFTGTLKNITTLIFAYEILHDLGGASICSQKY